MKTCLFSLLFTFFAVISHAADKGTWTGFITDDHCGVKSANESHAECARKCVAGGKTAVFVVGDKMYKFSDPKRVADLVGQKVTIKGELNGDVIEIKKVKKA